MVLLLLTDRLTGRVILNGANIVAVLVLSKSFVTPGRDSFIGRLQPLATRIAIYLSAHRPHVVPRTQGYHVLRLRTLSDLRLRPATGRCDPYYADTVANSLGLVVSPSAS